MAWVIGTANEEEIRALREKNFEVEDLPPCKEIMLFGGLRERESDDPDRLIMVYIEEDAKKLILGEVTPWCGCGAQR